jgi:hypothetical protein
MAALIEAKQQFKRGLIQQILDAKRGIASHRRSDWTPTPVQAIFKKLRNKVAIDPNRYYREIGIRSHGKGIFHKEPLLGSQLGEKQVFWVEPGCLTLNIVFAWEQALAVTTESERGMIASHRFPMFRPDKHRVNAEYVLLYLLSTAGKHLLGLASPGGAGRNRTLNQTKLLKATIPLPPLEEQGRIVGVVNVIERETYQLQQQLSLLKKQQEGLIEKLLTGEVRVKV